MLGQFGCKIGSKSESACYGGGFGSCLVGTIPVDRPTGQRAGAMGVPSNGPP